MAPHERRVRVYLEDTDAQGWVYHTNYLKYCERSRTDILMQAGFRLADLQDTGWTLVVHEMQVKFRKPARLHDEIEVHTTAKRSSSFRLSFHHEVVRAGEAGALLIAEVQVVAVGPSGDLVEIPRELLPSPVE
jgi:acyl-CoA thioester hydrolase